MWDDVDMGDVTDHLDPAAFADLLTGYCLGCLLYTSDAADE